MWSQLLTEHAYSLFILLIWAWLLHHQGRWECYEIEPSKITKLCMFIAVIYLYAELVRFIGITSTIIGLAALGFGCGLMWLVRRNLDQQFGKYQPRQTSACA